MIISIITILPYRQPIYPPAIRAGNLPTHLPSSQPIPPPTLRENYPSTDRPAAIEAEGLGKPFHSRGVFSTTIHERGVYACVWRALSLIHI